MARLTTEQEIDALRRSGKIAAAALQIAAQAVRPGISTQELNDIAHREITQRGGRPSFLGYHGFPAALCTSINDEVVHGIPSADRIVQEGDIIGLDIGVIVDGIFTDHAVTVPVGKISKDAQKLLSETSASLDAGIAAALVGNKVGAISAAVEGSLNQKKYGIVRQLVGHGVGKAIHEEPQIPNFGPADVGPVLKEGLVIAIEPMVTLGEWAVRTLDDDWTVVTEDGSLAAHFEHTVLITANGPEIITAW